MLSIKRKSEEEHYSPVGRSSDTLGICHTDEECLVLQDQVLSGLSEDAKPIWLELERVREAHVAECKSSASNSLSIPRKATIEQRDSHPLLRRALGPSVLCLDNVTAGVGVRVWELGV